MSAYALASVNFARENENLKMIEQMSQRMKMHVPVNSAEPWLSQPSVELYNNVLGFIQFLQDKLATVMDIEGKNEVECKIQQLTAWTELVDKLFAEQDTEDNLDVDLRKKVMKSYCAYNFNYIDTVDLTEITQTPQIFTARLAGTNQCAQVLTSVKGKPHNNSFDEMGAAKAKLFGTSKGLSDRRYESESSEDFDGDLESKFDSGPSVNKQALAVTASYGYILDKTLRLVHTRSEHREILTGMRCNLSGADKECQLSGENVIIKCVAKYNCDSEDMNESLRREFKAQYVLSKLKHPNINELLEYFENDGCIYTISRSGGSSDLMDVLSHYVTKYSCGMPEEFVKKLMFDGATGLFVAHNVGIAHRDVSLENMVMSDCEDVLNEAVVQTIDWGHCIATGLDVNGKFKETTYPGPIGKTRYMSPELILLKKELDAGAKVTYDPFKADVFAFGVCLFSMLTGQMPFEKVLDNRGQVLELGGLRPATALVNYLPSSKKINLSEDALNLLDKCLRWNPAQRATMAEVVYHPFFC